MPDGMAAGVGAAGLAGDSGAAVDTAANACGQEAGFADRGEGSPHVAPVEAESGSGVSDESLVVSMGESPEEEMLAMARAAADAISSGESVLIVGSSALWRRNVAMNFARVGLEVDDVAKGRLKGKNLENPKVAGRIERVALERLARDPADGVSWRALLAVGDHVARSAAVDKLRAAVSERADGSDAVRLLDALEMLRAGEFDVADIDRPIMDDLLAAYARARDLLKGAGSGSRESRFAGLSASDGVSSCASGGLDEGGISLCSLDDVAGRSADVVILGGFVNGAVPCRAYFDPAGLAGHARERERARCVRGLHGAAGAARSRLVVTGFTQANLQIAETMDLHIASIKLKDGVRTAILEPSAFLDLLQKG